MKMVSIIIPAYNAENYIGQCLDSVLKQTYKNIEIVVIDDGSNDKTGIIVREYQKKYNNIIFKSIENHGQGYARNLALKYIHGDYVMFLDSDDFIEKSTIELAVQRIDNDQSDFVIFDWKYYHQGRRTFIYNHVDAIFEELILTGKDVLKLFGISVYFTVNKLYKTNLLKNNNIRYMENYIYEDIPFWVQVVINAKKVSLINKPLYNVCINALSTTKTKYNTDFHYKSFIEAVKMSFTYTEYSRYQDNDFYDLYKYYLKKFQLYRKIRTPKCFRKRFTLNFLDVMSDSNLSGNMANKLLKYCYRLKVFKRRKYYLFNLLIVMKDLKKAFRKKNKQLKINFRKKRKNILNKTTESMPFNQKMLEEKADGKKIILFMGFDYRYTGNSRYLFEKLKKEIPSNFKLYFATDDLKVDEPFRVKPRSNFFNVIYKNADIIIFESWIPLYLNKNRNTIWIQLWHGTPLKKMLFDSNEKEIVSAHRRHKINKYNDIKRWNYLSVDNINVMPYFTSAFQIEKKKILPLGYPRVEFLLENINNQEIKRNIRDKYQIPYNKKVILYMPTWRDYNYEKKDIDKDYLLDVDELNKKLSNEYYVIFKDHSFLNKNDPLINAETQELLLIADYLITDYSSVMFDAFAIQLKTIIYSNDFEKYQQSRGVYLNIWDDLSGLVVDELDGVVTMINNYTKEDIILKLKEKYSYKNVYHKNLSNMIINYFNKKVYNPFIKRRLILVDDSTKYQDILDNIYVSKDDGFEIIIGNMARYNYEFNKNYVQKEIFVNDIKEVDSICSVYQIYQVINLTKNKYMKKVGD